jgi:hypothetical protein
LRPKLIALNLLLIAGVCAMGWEARSRWQLATAERQANLNVHIRSLTPPQVLPAPKPEAPPPVKYADVANKNLFTADRNPTVIIDPPKVEAPKPMPPLPVVYGTMGLPSGTKAIMARKPGEPGKAVRAGDTIGDFKVLALNSEKVTFEWEDKQIEKNIGDLVDRSNTQPAGSSGPAAQAAPQPVSAPRAEAAPAQNTNPSLGVELTPAMRACRPGDNSPAGTVVDGYKKQITFSPFGATCRWVKQ